MLPHDMSGTNEIGTAYLNSLSVSKMIVAGFTTVQGFQVTMSISPDGTNWTVVDKAGGAASVPICESVLA